MLLALFLFSAIFVVALAKEEVFKKCQDPDSAENGKKCVRYCALVISVGQIVETAECINEECQCTFVQVNEGPEKSDKATLDIMATLKALCPFVKPLDGLLISLGISLSAILGCQ